MRLHNKDNKPGSIFSFFSFSRYVLSLIIFLVFAQLLLLFPKTVNNFSSVSALKEFSDKMALEANDPALKKSGFFNATQSRKSVEQTLRGLHLVENINDQKGWELKATEAVSSGQDQWTVKKVNITFFADEVPTFKVRGDVGEVDGNSKDLVIRGQVVTESSNGYVFTTSELKYDADTKSLVSQDSVTMNGPRDNRSMNVNLNGFGLRIHIPTNKMYILDQVESKNLVNGEMFHLQSSEAEFSNRNQEALFSKNVRMKFQDYHTTSEKALFSMSANKNQVEEVILSPQVEMWGTNRRGTCRQLKIDILADKMTLSGQPSLTFNQDVISGDEIILTEKGQKVKINKAQLSGKDSTNRK